MPQPTADKIARTLRRRQAIAVLVLALLTPLAAPAAGFRQRMAPDPPGPALPLVVWYPSRAAPTPSSLWGFHLIGARNSPIAGRRLPLIVISHGTGGTALSHRDTATALADAGFVVVALSHTGDNFNDQSRAGFRRDLIDRPRQIRRVIDYMLTEWPDRNRLDPHRIGVFGYSLGGFTTLVVIGGSPDLRRMRQLCIDHPEAPDCDFIRGHGGDQLDPAPFPDPIWVHDRRVKAAVIAAPAASYVFGPGSLSSVRVPLQLWTASDDKMAPARWNSDPVRSGLPTAAETHVVPGVGHGVFMTPEICDPGAAGFDCAAFHQEFNAAVVDFFKAHLGPTPPS